VSSLIVEVGPKRLELLHELLPTAKVMAHLLNPDDRALAQAQAREVLSAARKRGLELHVLNARSAGDFDAVFADVGHRFCRRLIDFAPAAANKSPFANQKKPSL
jgi:hypothetical protein